VNRSTNSSPTNRLATIVAVLAVSILLASPSIAATVEEDSPTRLSPDRAFLGFSTVLEPLDDGGQGIRVFQLVPGSPADRAGLENGDLVVAIDGEPIDFADSVAMVRGLDRYKAGQRLELTLRRGGSVVTEEVVAGETSPEDLARLQGWLDAVEGGEGAGGNPACTVEPSSAAEWRRGAASARRWRELLRRVASEGGEVEFTVARDEDGGPGDDPEVLFASPGFRESGFRFDDLPESLRTLLVQLRPGDSVRYRIDAGDDRIVIDSLTPYPDYVELPDSAD